MRLVDNMIALRILYMLVTPFEKFDAFKLGLIGPSGEMLKKASTDEEKESTSMLHRLVWRLKRMIALVPGGSTKIGSLAAAYLLVKEAYENELTEEEAQVLYEDAGVAANSVGDGTATSVDKPLKKMKDRDPINRRSIK